MSLLFDRPFELTPAQLSVIELPIESSIFLEGPAGAGKTSAAVERMLALIEHGVPGNAILLVVPQRTLATPYLEALKTPGVVAGGQVTALTVGGFARRAIELFWPSIAGEAGFTHPDTQPTFLTMETAQYFMANLVRPLLDQGYFDTVTIDRNRIYSQILDNLNKSAVSGFSYAQIGERLKSAWAGEPGQLRVYEDVQFCANLFRKYCLEHNLLDFSLQIEVFLRHLWSLPAYREYFHATYRHLLADNLEEDTPVAHDLLREWLPAFESALLVSDRDAGFRRFLGADAQGAVALKGTCSQHITFTDSLVTSPAVRSLATHMQQAIRRIPAGGVFEEDTAQNRSQHDDFRPALHLEYHRYFPAMLDWVAESIAHLVHTEGVPPGEIAVLAPFLSDALRFSLSNRLEARNIPVRSHRPSRSLRDEPIIRCLLTLAKLAHTAWFIQPKVFSRLQPAKFDVAYALVQAIQDFDLVRAQLLTNIVFRMRDGAPSLSSFEQIIPEMRQRISYRMGERYENLRLWIEEYRQGPQLELDHFISRLFGEVLSQPGYGFHTNYPAGEVTANLVESIQKFRWIAGERLADAAIPPGLEYLAMVEDGVIAALYIRSWQASQRDAVLLAPAYTFLMSNFPVAVQYWLDIGSRGWSERLYQPLTHPYVLSRTWQPGKTWSDADEIAAGMHSLDLLVTGLLRRCRRSVFLGLSELGEQGYEQRGPLLRALQRIFLEQPAAGG